MKEAGDRDDACRSRDLRRVAMAWLRPAFSTAVAAVVNTTSQKRRCGDRIADAMASWNRTRSARTIHAVID